MDFIQEAHTSSHDPNPPTQCVFIWYKNCLQHDSIFSLTVQNEDDICKIEKKKVTIWNQYHTWTRLFGINCSISIKNTEIVCKIWLLFPPSYFQLLHSAYVNEPARHFGLTMQHRCVDFNKRGNLRRRTQGPLSISGQDFAATIFWLLALRTPTQSAHFVAFSRRLSKFECAIHKWSTLINKSKCTTNK